MKCPENEVEDFICDWAHHINLSANLDKQCAPLDEEQQEVCYISFFNVFKTCDVWLLKIRPSVVCNLTAK